MKDTEGWEEESILKDGKQESDWEMQSQDLSEVMLQPLIFAWLTSTLVLPIQCQVNMSGCEAGRRRHKKRKSLSFGFTRKGC